MLHNNPEVSLLSDPPVSLNTVDPFNLCAKATNEEPKREEWETIVTTIGRLETSIGLFQASLNAHKSRLKEVCPHPEHMIETKSIYVSASYYDPSETTKWRECQVCGTKSESITTRGGYG